MLPKSRRLNLKKYFKWVAAGYHKETPSFKLMFKEGENKVPKVGVAISSKHFKKAVGRNQAKRLSFNAASAIYSSLKSNMNLVIMPKSHLLNKKIEDLKTELLNLVK